jgi:hypothetical protein
MTPDEKKITLLFNFIRNSLNMYLCLRGRPGCLISQNKYHRSYERFQMAANRYTIYSPFRRINEVPDKTGAHDQIYFPLAHLPTSITM